MANVTPAAASVDEVTAARITEPNDWLRLVVLVLIAVAVHTWLFFHTYTTARDSIGFAQLALQYESPLDAKTEYPCKTPLDVLKHGLPPHPPGYPLAVLATSKVVREVYDGQLCDQMLYSTQIASIIAAVLLVFPSYAIGRMLFSRFSGFAAALLFQVLPVSARTTSDGLTEAWYLFFVATALAFGIRAVRASKVNGFCWCGMASGAAYLVRPEGLLVALSMSAVIVLLVLRKHWSLGGGLSRLVALGFGTMLLALPYMVAIGGVTLKPSLRMASEAQSFAHVTHNPTGFPGAALFAMNFDPSLNMSRELWVPIAIFKEASKAFHYGSMAFALIGVGFALRRVRTDPAILVTLVMGTLNLAVLALLAWKAGYLSERHTLPIVFLGCFFAAYACERLPGFIARIPWIGRGVWYPVMLMWMLYGAIILSCLPATIRPLHENRNGHKAIGEFLKENAHDDDVIIDPYNWAQYYSGRSLRGVPPDPSPARYRWAVLEEGEEPHSTLTRLKAAVDVKNDLNNKPEIMLRVEDTSDKRGSRAIVLYRQLAK